MREAREPLPSSGLASAGGRRTLEDTCTGGRGDRTRNVQRAPEGPRRTATAGGSTQETLHSAAVRGAFVAREPRRRESLGTIAALATLVTGAMWRQASRRDVAPSPSTTPVTVPAPSSPDPAPSASSTAFDPAREPSPALASPWLSVSTRPPPRPRAARSVPQSTSNLDHPPKDCAVPYTVDESGLKTYKRECL